MVFNFFYTELNLPPLQTACLDFSSSHNTIYLLEQLIAEIECMFQAKEVIVRNVIIYAPTYKSYISANGLIKAALSDTSFELINLDQYNPD